MELSSVAPKDPSKHCFLCTVFACDMADQGTGNNLDKSSLYEQGRGQGLSQRWIKSDTFFKHMW